MTPTSFKFQSAPPGVMRPVNDILQGDGFFVSHNDHDVAIYGGETTALVLGQMERFLILDGDHRAAYETLVEGGLDGCLDYFRSNAEHANHRSDTLASAEEFVSRTRSKQFTP